MEEPAPERVRARSADVMAAVHRLVRTALLYDPNNAAIRNAAVHCAEVHQAFTTDIGTPPTISFSWPKFFVNGELLRSTRQGWDNAADLAMLLERVHVSELTFEAGLQADALERFGVVLAAKIREAEERWVASGSRDVVFEPQLPGVETRWIAPRDAIQTS
jgi:hypothetical protein